MLKFIYQYDEDHPLIEVTLSPDSPLSDVLETFQGFLQAAGYGFGENEYIDVIDEEDEVTHTAEEN